MGYKIGSFMRNKQNQNNHIQTEPDWVIFPWTYINSCLACWKWGSCGSTRCMLFICQLCKMTAPYMVFILHNQQHEDWSYSCLPSNLFPKHYLGTQNMSYSARAADQSRQHQHLILSPFPSLFQHICKSLNKKHLDNIFMLPFPPWILLLSPAPYLYSNSTNTS